MNFPGRVLKFLTSYLWNDSAWEKLYFCKSEEILEKFKGAPTHIGEVRSTYVGVGVIPSFYYDSSA